MIGAFSPALYPALRGALPGVMDGDPQFFGVGGGIGGRDPRVQDYGGAGISPPNNSLGDPRGLNSPRGGFGAPAMPMGDMPKEGGPTVPRPNGMFGNSGKPDWKMAIAAGLAGWSAARGNPAGQMAMQSILRMREAQQEAALRNQMPQQVGGSLVQYNPQSGGYDTLFRDPEPFENYAASLNLQPGTPEYMDAIRNYRLGSWSDDAVAARMANTGYRFDRQGVLQEDRQDFQSGQQEDRQQFSAQQQGVRLDRQDARANKPKPAPAPKSPQSEGALYADIMRRWAQGGQMNGREREFVRAYELRHQSGGKGRGGSKPSASADLVGPVHTKGNQRIQYSKSKGAYVDLATGQAVR